MNEHFEISELQIWKPADGDTRLTSRYNCTQNLVKSSKNQDFTNEVNMCAPPRQLIS
jgi:hypothetical protein